MKFIEVRQGSKTTYKMVADDYEETDDTICRDMTTSGRKSMGYSDISKEQWDSIFKSRKDTLTIARQSRDDSCVEEDLTLKPNYFRR